VSAIVVSGFALKWDALREQQGGGPVWPRYGSSAAATAPAPAE